VKKGLFCERRNPRDYQRTPKQTRNHAKERKRERERFWLSFGCFPLSGKKGLKRFSNMQIEILGEKRKKSMQILFLLKRG
jgi:hypothetical protein